MDINSQIITEIKKGNLKTFELLYYKYNRGLISFANSFIHDRVMAEDIVHESFFAFWQQRENLYEEQNIKGFLFGIVRNKSMNYLREKVNTTLSFEDMTENDFFISRKLLSLESIESYEIDIANLNKEIAETYNSLPDIYKEVFDLSRKEHLSNREIAELLNISVKAVEKRMTKTLKIFKERLGDKYILFLILYC